MVMPAVTIQEPSLEADDHIAELRGLVDKLNEVLGAFTGGTIQVTDPLVATDPVNGGPETWHTLGTLLNFNITRARFRLDPQGELEIDIGIDGNGANVSGSAFSVTMPAAYRPAVTRRCTLSETGRNITAGDLWPAVIVAATGVVTIQAQAGIMSALHANPHFPLD